jgi:hypothetical protein
MKYVCKIVAVDTGVQDSGFFEVSPPFGEIDSGLS